MMRKKEKKRGEGEMAVCRLVQLGTQLQPASPHGNIFTPPHLFLFFLLEGHTLFHPLTHFFNKIIGGDF